MSWRISDVLHIHIMQWKKGKNKKTGKVAVTTAEKVVSFCWQWKEWGLIRQYQGGFFLPTKVFKYLQWTQYYRKWCQKMIESSNRDTSCHIETSAVPHQLFCHLPHLVSLDIVLGAAQTPRFFVGLPLDCVPLDGLLSEVADRSLLQIQLRVLWIF